MFCSAKGGVGKSTLAVACAIGLAERGRAVLLLDADFTGTSLADGLRMEAPRLRESADGVLDLVGPTSGRLEPAEYWVRRKRRAGRSPLLPHSLPFLNDALAFQGDGEGAECGLADLAWRVPGPVGTRVLPSSPLREDVEVALGWLQRPQQERRPLVDRFEALLWQAVSHSGITDILVDLPPGLFGFATDLLAMSGRMARSGQVDAVPCLVTTEDRNDLASAVDAYLALAIRLPRTRLILNRRSEGVESARAWVREHYKGLGIDQQLVPVDNWRRSLGRLFLDGGLAREEEARAQVARALALGGA